MVSVGHYCHEGQEVDQGEAKATPHRSVNGGGNQLWYIEIRHLKYLNFIILILCIQVVKQVFCLFL